MHRFYLPAEAFAGNYVNSQDKKLINQLAKVLRVKDGDRCLIFDNSGYEFVCQLIHLDKALAKFLIIDKKASDKELPRDIIIYQSLLKADKFEWILQKAAELGVRKVVPVVSERSIVRQISDAKKKRWQEVVREAAEQCGASKIMEIGNLVDFDQALELASYEGGFKILTYEGEKDMLFKNRDGDKFAVFVGPEGGWSQEEAELAVANGFEIQSFGPRILRAETAAIYVASILACPLT